MTQEKLADKATKKCLLKKDITHLLARQPHFEFPYTYHKLACTKCGRKIIVEVLLIGVDHTASITAVCAECLKKGVNKEFAEKNPEAAKDIEEWIKHS